MTGCPASAVDTSSPRPIARTPPASARGRDRTIRPPSFVSWHWVTTESGYAQTLSRAAASVGSPRCWSISPSRRTSGSSCPWVTTSTKEKLGAVDDESGGEDDDWYSSFFEPYRYVIARVPVFPAIGNHDTTDTEGSDDRAQMEDNFHVDQRFEDDADRSSVGPGLFYRLHYGRDVELVCIDTSMNPADEGGRRYFQDDKHRRWLEKTFAQPRRPLAHPVCASPGVLRRTVPRERPGDP